MSYSPHQNPSCCPYGARPQSPPPPHQSSPDALVADTYSAPSAPSGAPNQPNGGYPTHPPPSAPYGSPFTALVPSAFPPVTTPTQQTASKKRKVDAGSSSGGVIVPFTGWQSPTDVAQTTAPEGDGPNKAVSLPRKVERLALTINPDFMAKLRLSKTLGFERIPAVATPRCYTINVDTFRQALTHLTSKYLKIKMYEQETLTYAQVDAEVETMTPIVVNACMAALYGKLRTIHKQFQTYATRFPTAPSYSEDIELPLPFADAIQNFGVFTPLGTVSHYLCIPVYPEGTNNEGCSEQNWHSYHYEAFMPYMKALGIPLKSVDTRLKIGSAWWTYRPELVYEHYDLRCIFPPLNYSDHSAVLASMFIQISAEPGEAAAIIQFHDDDIKDYPVRLRELPEGFQLRAFAALCHAPRKEWL